MAKRVLALAAAAGCLACFRSGVAEQAREGAASRVEPLVLAPGTPGEPGAVRIAAIFPTLGRYAVSGRQSLNGARLAVQEANRTGGIHGRSLELREYHTGSYFVDAGHAARLAIAEGAVAIVGSNSSELSMAVAEEAEAHGVVQISNVSTAQDLTWDARSGRDRPFIFRVCSSDVVMGARLAEFARTELGAHRAAVLYEVGRTYSARLARAFVEVFRSEAAGRVAAEFFYLTLETDFRPQLRRVLGFRPDVLFVPGSFTDATLVAAQASALGLRAPMLGADAWSSPLLFRRAAPPGGAFFVDHCFPPPSFERWYREVFGEETHGCRAVLAHDAVRAIAAGLTALGRLGSEDLQEGLPATRSRLRDAVARARVPAATGLIRFDAHGDRQRGVALYAVDRGGWPRPRGWLGEP